MADYKSVIVVGSGPIKNGPALHGADIGYVYGGYNVQLTVDYATLHDGWVAITNPNPWEGKSNPNHEQGWIKWSRVAVDDPQEIHLLVTYYTDGRAPMVKVVS